MKRLIPLTLLLILFSGCSASPQKIGTATPLSSLVEKEVEVVGTGEHFDEKWPRIVSNGQVFYLWDVDGRTLPQNAKKKTFVVSGTLKFYKGRPRKPEGIWEDWPENDFYGLVKIRLREQ